MNQNFYKLSQINSSSIGCGLLFILICLLLGSVGLGWVVNGFFIFLFLLFITPPLLLLLARWWIRRKLVEDECPVCDYRFMGFDGVQMQCPSCGESLNVTQSGFQRITPPGTIDVEAVNVEVVDNTPQLES
ncbi:hypothetical protein [Spirulina subsalsa]|uniref:hypothetical protein n=1 Tax=Spirulina subsalsa TaxID=54311 RepID=UPI00037438B2|nr:hypothetical protein [Spirulina subsalsa]